MSMRPNGQMIRPTRTRARVGQSLPAKKPFCVTRLAGSKPWNLINLLGIKSRFVDVTNLELRVQQYYYLHN